MRRAVLGATGLVLFCCAGPAEGFITRLTPLREVLANEQLIFTVKVDKIDPKKPSLVFKMDECLKGKMPFQKLAVSLTGDSEGQREQHTAKILKRLAVDQSLVFFASKRGKRYTAFGYTNGTWFQLLGQVEDDPETIRWGFTHCEPYLRRTFKGTTGELKEIIKDGLSGKKEPPAPNSKEEPGLGPEIKEDDKPAKKEGASVSGGPALAVIPTFAILAPLALLASLFGFGGLALFVRRWMVILSLACLYSALLLARGWFGERLHDSWWASAQALCIALAGLMFVGVFWSWRRFRSAARLGQTDDARLQPVEVALLRRLSPWSANTLDVYLLRPVDAVVLRWLSLAGIGVCLYALGRGSLAQSPWRELFLGSIVVWLGTLYVRILGRAAARRSLQFAPRPETVMLGAGALLFAGLSAFTVVASLNPRFGQREVAEHDSASRSAEGETPRRTGESCSFQASSPGTFDSTPLVTGNRVYIAGALRAGFSSAGVLYCLEHVEGKLRPVWSFDDEGGMKQVFSSPCLAGGRIYVGEGYHQDSDCKLYCIEAERGTKLWAFLTRSHTESSPVVSGGKVFFGAGEDGVYCLDALTGKQAWHWNGGHVDTSPAVEGNRLYAGSGYGDHCEFFCLNSATGEPLWQVRSDLPVFGSPTVVGEQVFFGTGTGNFLESAHAPAGAVVCLRADDGHFLWQFDTPDAVHDRPAVDRRQVYFGSRDHHLYAVGRLDGRLRWKRDLGSPIVARPALVTCSECGDSSSVYAVAAGGLVACLDPADGKIFWDLELAGETLMKTQLLSSPRVVVRRTCREEYHSVYFGSGLDNSVEWTARLFCLEDGFKLPVPAGSWRTTCNP